MLALSVIRSVSCAAAGLAVAGLAVAGLAVAGCTWARPADPALSRTSSVVGPASLPPASDLTAAQIARFRWSGLPGSPLGPQYGPLVIWAGGELYEFASDTGAAAAFSPATGRWRRIAAPPRNIGSGDAAAVWTGSRLLVTSGGALCLDGRTHKTTTCWAHYIALYDPSANRWSVASLPAQLAGFVLTDVVWTGHDAVVAGAGNPSGHAVAAYSPATGRWQIITPVTPAGHKVFGFTMVATPGRLILWSYWDKVTATSPHAYTDAVGVDVLAMTRDGTWRNVTGHWPQTQWVTSPLFTGSAILVPPSRNWCGTLCMNGIGSYPGYFANPATLQRTIIPDGLFTPVSPGFVWTGHAIIGILGSDVEYLINSFHRRHPVHVSDMMLWDLTSSRWLQLPSPPGYPPPGYRPDSGLSVVWTGSQMLVLIGSGKLLAFHR